MTARPDVADALAAWDAERARMGKARARPVGQRRVVGRLARLGDVLAAALRANNVLIAMLRNYCEHSSWCELGAGGPSMLLPGAAFCTCGLAETLAGKSRPQPTTSVSLEG